VTSGAALLLNFLHELKVIDLYPAGVVSSFTKNSLAPLESKAGVYSVYLSPNKSPVPILVTLEAS
jgi:hypothetical protein